MEPEKVDTTEVAKAGEGKWASKSLRVLVTGPAILVTNISPKASETEIKNFFGYCGIVKSVVMSDTGDTRSAVVQFAQSESVQIALLLINSILVDKPIMIEPYHSPPPEETKPEPVVPEPVKEKMEVEPEPIVKPEEPKEPSQPADQVTAAVREEVTTDEKIEKKPETVETGPKGIIEALRAAGYQLGTNALQKAEELDYNYAISLKVSVYYESSVNYFEEKAKQFDDLDLMEEAKKQYEKVDKKLGISDKADQLMEKSNEFKEQMKTFAKKF